MPMPGKPVVGGGDEPDRGREQKSDDERGGQRSLLVAGLGSTEGRLLGF